MSRRFTWTLSMLVAIALGYPTLALAQTPTVVGYLSNFDVPNNLKDNQGNPREAEGFEIQIEGIQVADISYAFGEAGALNGPAAPCYIRYCRPHLIPYATGVYVRWTVGGWDSIQQQFTSNFNIPGMTLSSAGTPPVASTAMFAGHQCWSMGMGAQYANAGCEHFGVSLVKAAGAVTYRWIVGDPATGTLTYPDGLPLPTATSLPPGVAVPQVPILAPVVNVAAGEVQAVLQAPPPPPPAPAAPARRYGNAQWVKVYKKELPRQADLDELVGGHPNNNVPGINGDARDEAAVAETEWKLLQLDTCNPSKGSSQLVNHGSSGSHSHSVVRRYEFYAYAGPVEAAGESGCGGKGSPKLSTEGHAVCAVDPVTGECPAPQPGELGDYIGAQNVGDNLNPNDGRTHQSIGFDALVDVAYPHDRVPLIATASSNLPVTFSAIGACSVLAGGFVAINGAGGCVVTASQEGDATFAPASDVLRAFLVNKASQTISFDLPPGPFRFTDPAFDISASASSGLPVSFSASGACTVAQGLVAITGAGLCQITASQAGDGNFEAATDVVRNVTFGKGSATVVFDAGTLAQTYDGLAKTVSTTTNPGGLTVKLSFTGTPQDAGSYPVSAAIDDPDYEGTASGTLTIAKAKATIVVTPYDATYNGEAHTATASALGVDGVTEVGSFVMTGTTHTDAGAYPADTWNFAGGTNYSDDAGTVSDRIGKANATIVVTPYAATYDGAPHSATASGLGVDGVTSVGSFTLTGTTHTDAGTYAADPWSFSGGANYNDASGTVSDSIARASQAIAFGTLPDRTFGDAAFLVSATASSGLPVSFGASGTCTAIGNLVSLTAAGICTITASQAGNGNYNPAADVAQSFSIAPAPPPPPAANRLANPGPQTNAEGDEVELELQVVRSATSGARRDDDAHDNRPLGVFSAAGLPPQLHLEKEHGVIRGHLSKGSAGVYTVTVSFTSNGVTYTQSFTWTVVAGARAKGDRDR